MAASSKARGPPAKDNSGKHPVLLTKGKIELHIGMKIEAMVSNCISLVFLLESLAEI